MDLPAHGSPRPARRRAPISWSAVSRLEERTQAFSNTSSSDRLLSRRHCRPCVSDEFGPEKHRSLPSSAAIKARARQRADVGLFGTRGSLLFDQGIVNFGP